MAWVSVPLTVGSVVTSWRWDLSTLVVTVALGGGYGVARVRGRAGVPGWRVGVFSVVGLGVWVMAGIGVVGVYSGTLFWVRALQVVLLLYVVPFGLAAGRPVTVLRAALGPDGRARLDGIVNSAPARAATYPLVSSVAILAAPWLLFLTPWYELVLRNGLVDAATRIILVAIGFGYFYSRLQIDPVPRRYSQGVSLLITIVESLADGILGLVLWFGPLCAADYYLQIGRDWGPDPRLDQIIGAGVLWILGDVLGLPYLLTLMRSWAADERRAARDSDAELDAPVGSDPPGEQPLRQDGLWWENDPQLRARFRR
ncbi:cytochrome c oxidase assembly protein [Nocardia sp. NPDC004068]|uniref:cytochrome c oxidase assembly protein n=1 Tax=Nocardia sp. NPDC004068 TaxID=3364303 RepID=UPI0036902E5F